MSTPPIRRRTASHEVSAALLRAAETVLDRDGSDGVTIRAVALAAEVSPTSVYNRFQSKDGLIVALAMRTLTQLGDAVDVPADLGPDGRFRQAGADIGGDVFGPHVLGVGFGGAVGEVDFEHGRAI